VRQSSALAECKADTSDAGQIECIFRVIRFELRAGGVEPAMNVFSRAYREFPSFVSAACHSQAHRLGDMAYFEVYLASGDIDSVDFPQSTTACGYGFYHGFTEHLVQDHPEVEFVMQSCEYLTERLGETMGDIEMTCYHGSGHGLMLAQSERVPREKWGSVSAFTSTPLSQCDALTRANERDVEECKEGIFNVLNEWMVLKQNGFSYDTRRPFSACVDLPKSALEACYYEMAQKLDGVAEFNPQKLEKIVSNLAHPEFRVMAFSVGVAGIVQNVILHEDGITKILALCSKLPEDLNTSCIRSVVNGLFEHGEPQEEYKRAISMCSSDPSISGPSSQDTCFNAVALRLARFYPSERVRRICTEFPEEYRAMCESETADWAGNT
jgi:hypothetical protein